MITGDLVIGTRDALFWILLAMAFFPAFARVIAAVVFVALLGLLVSTFLVLFVYYVVKAFGWLPEVKHDQR